MGIQLTSPVWAGGARKYLSKELNKIISQ